jgi:predicted TIM-barrel fold metal-dependent hydrolase
MLRRDFVDLGTKLAIARMLGSAKPHAASVLDADRRVRERSPRLVPPYLDAHAHSASALLLAYRAVSGGPTRGESPTDGAELIRRMDADGIRRAIVLSTAYQMAADAYGTHTSESAEYARVRLENDFTAAECERNPGRLVPFFSVNPKRGYAVEEVDRCVAQKMRGLKLHLWNSLVDTRQAPDLAALKRVVARAAHHRMPVVAHILVGAVPNYGPDDTERFVREIILPFDTLQISLAHLGGAGGFGVQQQACFQRLIALCGPDAPWASRVWTDMAAVLTATTSADEARRLGELLPQWGLRRVLWGSDNLDGALALTRTQWPLDPIAWQAIADQRGTTFVAA